MASYIYMKLYVPEKFKKGSIVSVVIVVDNTITEPIHNLGVCIAIIFFKWRSWQVVQVGLWTLWNWY